MQRAQRLVRRPLRPKAVRAGPEVLFINRFQNHRDRPLRHLVFEGRDAERKEDGREYDLKPSIVVRRVQLPPGKGQSASRKPALRVTAMVARSVGEQVLKLRESASKSVNAEALVVRIAGAASTWPL